jgi:NADPH-dependent 2,4-dienoyl-CoA reductase/sulfur reductase-like enzyme
VSDRSSDIVIVGGSVAATRAAEAARRHAPSLSITVVTDESHLPYERPPLSKLPIADAVDLDRLTYPAARTLRDDGVDFMLGARAEALDLEAREVRTSRGVLGYQALVIATGCEPLIPPLFKDLPDVYALRRYEDAVAVRAAVRDSTKPVAIVGAGFIGGEFAATLAKENRQVALIDLAHHPLGRFGDAVAHRYESLHREAGVTLHLGSAAVAVTEEKRRSILLYDGTSVPADVIVVGVGVRPSTDWLRGAGLLLEDGIACSADLRAAAGQVYAAGDVVRWPNGRYGTPMRIEHWTTAAEQGRIAGINAANGVLGNPAIECSTVPYFWSDQHGVRIQFAGYRTGEEEIFEHTDEAGSLFVYRRGDEVAGVLAFEQRSLFVRLRAALRTSLSWQQAQEIMGLNPAAPA